MSLIRIALADQDTTSLAGMEEYFGEHPDFKVRVLAETTKDIRALLKDVDVDIVVTNDETPIPAGKKRMLDAVQVIESAKETPVAAYLSHAEFSRVARMRAAGAKLILSKKESMKTLAMSLKEIVAGKDVSAEDEISRMTWNSETQGELRTLLNESLTEKVTKREAEVVDLVSHGLSNKLIAEELGISIETVKEHVQNILRKLNVKDRTQAAVQATKKLMEIEKRA